VERAAVAAVLHHNGLGPIAVLVNDALKANVGATDFASSPLPAGASEDLIAAFGELKFYF
jgi:hypothetical protein